MGDHGTSLGMTHLANLIRDNTPEGTVVHSLETGEGTLGDILSGFLKNANTQVHGGIAKKMFAFFDVSFLKKIARFYNRFIRLYQFSC